MTAPIVNPPIVRIILRYFSAWLLTKGVDAAILADPDVEAVAILAAGLIVSFCNEYWYYLAIKYGWKK